MTDTVRLHPETGATLTRGVRRTPVEYRHGSVTVDLPGWYPDGDGDGLHDVTDMRLLDRALNRLKAEAEGLPTAEDIRRIRRRLRLSQRRAGELLGGGPRAFQKYEAGDVLVSRPMANLLKLLDSEPSLLARLGDQRAA
ncbi:type II toxin-antitoxin system MqsA family antitoxin [Pseudoxanthobacter sp. M-2]|uniref:type II TA system antitoxin MqsA family protein n=1 Tax=Pseudoxanthobacter sp. M-2 TaxID=3078754 RepID=UPI0038FD0908